MSKDEALRLALGALVLWDARERQRVIAAIKEALDVPEVRFGKIAAQPAQEVVPLYTISLQKQEPVTHTINSTRSAAVATDHYWIPIDASTPRGVKLQLLGKGGVAQYSNYHGDRFWTHWAPLPKRGD